MFYCLIVLFFAIKFMTAVKKVHVRMDLLHVCACYRSHSCPLWTASYQRSTRVCRSASTTSPTCKDCRYVQLHNGSMLSNRLLHWTRQEALLLQKDCERHLSVEILQLQNISLENPIMWHYLRDSMFSRFDTIPECDRHTHTHRQL